MPSLAATIAQAPIDNLSTKAFSRCKASLLVNYDTAPGHILALRDRIREWLATHPKVRQDKVEVSVTRLTAKLCAPFAAPSTLSKAIRLLSASVT